MIWYWDIKTGYNSWYMSLSGSYCRWNNHILVLFFKCLTGRAPNYLCSQFTFTHSTHDRSTRGNSYTVFLFLTLKVILVWEHSMFNRAANLWNTTVNIHTCSSFDSMSLSQFKLFFLVQEVVNLYLLCNFVYSYYLL